MSKNLVYETTIYIFILSILFIINQSMARDVIDGVIAVINDDVITLSEFIEKLPNQNQKLTPKQEKIILDRLIEQKLLEQEADKLGISVSEIEIDEAIRNISNNLNLTDEQMKEVLIRENLSPEAFREQWRVQLLSQKVVGVLLKGQVAVTDDEVKEYYEKNYENKENVREVKIAHILITPELTGGDAEARERAAEVANLAKSGEDFGELAKLYSDDKSSSVRGGELGYFKRGDLVGPLEEAAIKAPVGSITGPVKSPAGYHIIMIIDKKSGESSLDEVKNEIREKLYREKAEKELKAWIDEMKRSAYIDLRI